MDISVLTTIHKATCSEYGENLNRRTSQKYCERVGQTATAKAFDENAISLAVVAYIRHTETRYDELLSSGIERKKARRQDEADTERVLEKWRARRAL